MARHLAAPSTGRRRKRRDSTGEGLACQPPPSRAHEEDAGEKKLKVCGAGADIPPERASGRACATSKTGQRGHFMQKLLGRYPRLMYYLVVAMSLALASGAGKKFGSR